MGECVRRDGSNTAVMMHLCCGDRLQLRIAGAHWQRGLPAARASLSIDVPD